MLEEATSLYSGSLSADHAEALEARGLGLGSQLSSRLGTVSRDNPYPGHERFKGWLSIPYLDQDGLPLTMRFRCMKDHDHSDPYGQDGKGRHGKYMTMFEDPPRTFNIGAIHRAGDTIEITEGEMDALLLESLGLHAIAIPGVELWKPHHPRMLAGFNRVRVWGDPDDAGARLVAKICHQMRQAKMVRLTVGDVGETFKQGGADAIMELIS